jgi:hypothetical protein
VTREIIISWKVDQNSPVFGLAMFGRLLLTLLGEEEREIGVQERQHH